MQIVSDIHLDVNNMVDVHRLVIPSAKYLAILGDIGFTNKHKSIKFVKYCSSAFDKVFIVLGNHDYYSCKKHQNMQHVVSNIKTWVSIFTNVHILDNDVYKCDEFTVIGTTLWSNVSSYSAQFINDFNNIYTNDKLVTWSHISTIHRNNVNWLHYIIDTMDTGNKPIIVLSHHLPSFDLIDTKYKSCVDIQSAFASNLNGILKHVNYWFFGHTHAHVRKIINGCTCACNPYGYGDENPKYQTDYVVAI